MSETDGAASRPRYRRRKILVQPAYQLRVALYVLLSITFYSGLLAVLLFYPLIQEFGAADTERQVWIAHYTLEMHARFWPRVLLVAVLVGVQSLFVTHRIVGPSFHLARVLRQLGAGQLGARAHLRRWDRLKDLEGAVNGLGEALESRERERAARLQAAAATLRQGLEGATVSPQVLQAVAELEREAARSEPAA